MIRKSACFRPGAHLAVVSFFIRFACLLGLLSSVSSAAEYRLKFYDYPRTKGASWIYQHRYPGEPLGRFLPKRVRVTLTDLDCPVEMTRGRSHPEIYQRKACRFVEETGYWNVDDFFTDRNKVYERSCFYRGMERGGCYHYGTDQLSRTDDPGRVKPMERLDRGMLLPPVLRVGERFSSNVDYYEKGRFRGVVDYSVRLVSHGAVTVPYGTFHDCIRLRFVIRAGDRVASTDEWWARGVGMVKAVSTNVDPFIHELEAVRFQGDRPARPTILEYTPATPGLEFVRMYEGYDPDYFRVSIPQSYVDTLRLRFEIRNSGDGMIRNLLAELKYPLDSARIIKTPRQFLKPGDSTFLELEIKPVYDAGMHAYFFSSYGFRLTRGNGKEKRDVTLMILAYIQGK